MEWLISIIICIILYLSIEYLYKRYKKEMLENEKQFSHMQIKIGEIERKNNMNEQMINWLYTTLQNKAIINKEDNKGDNNELYIKNRI